MNSIERQRFLLDKAVKNNFVSIPDSAAHLHVSVETIRRDINILCGQKKLRKVHGGAVPIHAAVRKDPAYSQRFQRNPQGKAAIAAEAAKLIRNGDVVTIDGGATTTLVAQHITNVRDVTFVINSLHTANILIQKIEMGEISGTIIFIGGELKPQSLTTDGSYTVAQLDDFHFDICFASASSFSVNGAANSTLTGIYVSKMLKHSAVKVLVVDSDKLGDTSTFRFANATDFDWVITDDHKPVPQDLYEVLISSNTKLKVVCCNG